MITQGKTLAELRAKVELGFTVYCTSDQEVTVYKDAIDDYDNRDENGRKMLKTVYMLSLPGRSLKGIGQGMGYPSIDDLISDALIPEVTAPVWSMHR